MKKIVLMICMLGMAAESHAALICQQQDQGLMIVVDETTYNGSTFFERSIYQIGTGILVSAPVIVIRSDIISSGPIVTRGITVDEPDSTLHIESDAAGNLVGHASGTFFELERQPPTPQDPDGNYEAYQNFDPSLKWNCQE